MRGPDLKPRKLRPSPVRDGLRPSRQEDRATRRARTDKIALQKGLCLRCFKPRGPLGTSRYCRPCCSFRSEHQRYLRTLQRLWSGS